MSSENKSMQKQEREESKRRPHLLVFIIIVLTLLTATGLWWRANQFPSHEGMAIEDTAAEHEANEVMLDEAAQRNIGLKVEAAQLRPLVQTVQTTGSVGPDETRVAHILPLARGRIEKVHVRLGDRVRAGQPLMTYDNIELGELIGEYLSALAMLEKANADAEVTKRSLERAQNLVEIGALARAEYEQRTAEHKNALASINSQTAEIARIEEKIHRFGLTDADLERLNLLTREEYHREASHNVLRAPFDGVVIKSEAAEGEVVETERELFTIVNLSTVWVQADVYEKDIAFIRQGQEVKILVDAYPEETFVGELTYVSDFLDPQTRTAKVRCEVPNPVGRLKLQMFATIHIPTQSGREALMIPQAAVQQLADESVVFVKEGGTEFQKRAVAVGLPSDGWIEITSGLRAGEQVVTEGSFALKSELKKRDFGEHEH